MQLILQNKTNCETLSLEVMQKIAESVLTLKNQPTEEIAVGVFVVGAEEIREINREYRHKDKATDVITFRLMDTASGKKLTKENFPLDYDYDNGGLYLGDIFICYEVAESQAGEMGHTTDREIAELLVHGMLHILGHDHEVESEAKVMKNYEEAMYPYLDKLVR